MTDPREMKEWSAIYCHKYHSDYPISIKVPGMIYFVSIFDAIRLRDTIDQAIKERVLEECRRCEELMNGTKGAMLK
jgi:hypothetical protein